MPRDFASAVGDEPIPHPAISRAINATPYIWRDPATIPTRDWVYGHQMLRGSVSVVVAPGATGKTALMIGTTMALVSGRPLLGHSVWGGPKAVWLWNLEDSGDELARAIQAAAMHWGIAPGDLVQRSVEGEDCPLLYVDSGLDGAELKTADETPNGTRINGPVISALVEQLRSKSIDVLIVDPFVSSHNVNENDNRAIDLVAKQWAKVATIAGCAIVLVHHSRKLGGAEVGAETARGASALVAAARSVPTLNRMTPDEADRFGIEGEDRRRFFRVYDDKNNRAPPSDSSDWYRLHSVSLGNGDDGGDSLPVVVPWSPPNVFDSITVDHLRRVQERVAAGEWRESSQAGNWVGQAVAEVTGLDADRDAKSDRVKINALLRAWVKNGALVIVERRDPKKREDKKFVEVGEWAVTDTAPPRTSGAGQGGASGAAEAPRPTTPPKGGVGVGQAGSHPTQVGQHGDAQWSSGWGEGA